jgi:energy-converting hydrogenase Eha subunit B
MGTRILMQPKSASYAGRNSFIAILLAMFGLTAEQASRGVMGLVTDVLDIKGVDADARTVVLEDYIERLMDKHDLEQDIHLMSPNGRPKNCKM